MESKDPQEPSQLPSITEDISELLRKYALQNAVRHGGRAQPGPVLGKALAERPDLKSLARDLAKAAAIIVSEVNRMTIQEQRRLIEERWPELLEEQTKLEEKALPPLPNVDQYERIVTRYAPNPDFVLHFGQARAIYLSHDYAKMYKGKFILRFEDTDPRLKRPRLEYYDAIREDILWLGCRWDEEYLQSARMPIYYEYAERLLKDSNAYICICKIENFRAMLWRSEACPCRNLPPEDQMDRWEKMLDGRYREGGAVLRIKTDLKHPNPSIRDWVALRIIDTKRYPHPLVGDRYRVWPTYNFAAGIDDHLMGISHIIRGKEFIPSVFRQSYLYHHLGWKYPDCIHYGKWKILHGGIMSKSRFLKGLKEGLYEGIDDPRLATLAALRRRGIQPEAIHKMIVNVGIKPVDVSLSWENLYAINRKLVDPIANRYFFVDDPILLKVRKVGKAYIARPFLHPSFIERGRRVIPVQPENGIVKLFISRRDGKNFKPGKLVRLMELFNILPTEIGEETIDSEFHSEGLLEARKVGAQLIHWIPASGGIETTVLMPDASKVKGISEESCKELKVGQIVQFERFGFVRIESLAEGIKACYTHS
ncbi:MAG: glutamate--tRNA ligase [Candidatus Bathyarchaeia archaeon]